MPQQKPQAAPDFIPAEAPDFIPMESSDFIPVDKGEVLPPQAQQPGFVQALAHAFGVDKDNDQAQQFKNHPIKEGLWAAAGPAGTMVRSLINAGKSSGGELKHAFDDAKEGNAAGVASHVISAIPMVGPALDTMNAEAPATHPGESWWDQEKGVLSSPGTLGTGVGTAAQLAPVALSGVDAAAPERPLVGEIPTRAKAGKLFESVMKDAGNQPVQMTRAMEPMERAQQISARGGGAVGAVDNLYKRVNTINPLDYREARDWASNLSRLSGQDAMNASPALKAQVGKLSHAFNEDIGDTAASVGRGEDYANAMKMYRQAARNGDIAKSVAKKAIPLMAGGGLVAAVLKKVFE